MPHEALNASEDKQERGERTKKDKRRMASKEELIAKADHGEGLTDGELSVIVGINRTTLNRYRNGERSPSGEYKETLKGWEPSSNKEKWLKTKG